MEVASLCERGLGTRLRWRVSVWSIPCLQALLTDRHGRGVIVDGPQRVSVWRKKFERLERLSADQYQYIRIQKSNGEVEHMPG